MPRFGKRALTRRKYPSRKYGKFKSNPMNLVTTERDFSYTGTALMNKKKSPSFLKALKYKKRKWLKYKAKVKKAIGKPKTKIKFLIDYGRSWVSAANSQAVALLPILSYRGVTSPSGNVAAGNPPITSVQYFHRMDDVTQIYNYYSLVYFPSSTGTLVAENTLFKNPWFCIKRGAIDITITNTGADTISGTPEGSNCPAEYEIYMVYPKRKVSDNTTSMNTPTEWISRANTWTETKYGGTSTGAQVAIAPSDPCWKTWTTAGVKNYVKSKLIGRGYLGLGESTRFYKTIKTRYFTSQQRLIDDDPNLTNTKDPWFKGLTAIVMVVWRGTPKPGFLSGGWGPCRLNFNVQREIDTWSASAPLQPGVQSTKMYADTTGP